MKKVLIPALVMLLSSQLSAAKSDNFDAIDSCIKEAYTRPPGENEIASRCFDLALPWASSSSVRGRALYLRMLQVYLGGGTDRPAYEALEKRLSHYYTKNLASEITGEAVGKWDRETLLDVFTALHGTQAYASIVLPEEATIASLEIIFRELEKRKLATETQATEFYQALVETDNWDKAKNLKNRRTSVSSETLPNLVVQDKISSEDLGYYTLSEDLSTLTLKKFDYKTGTRIVMVGDCHFAIDAMKVLDQFLPDSSEKITKVKDQHVEPGILPHVFLP